MQIKPELANITMPHAPNPVTQIPLQTFTGMLPRSKDPNSAERKV